MEEDPELWHEYTFQVRLYQHMSKRGLSLVDATPAFAHVFSFLLLLFNVVISVFCDIVLLRITAEQ